MLGLAVKGVPFYSFHEHGNERTLGGADETMKAIVMGKGRHTGADISKATSTSKNILQVTNQIIGGTSPNT